MIKKYAPTFTGAVLTIAVIGLMFSVFLLGEGYHSVDLSQNARFLEAKYDMQLEDVTLQGKVLTSIEMYQFGWWYIRISFMLMFLSALVFTSALIDLIYMVKKK